MKVLVQQLVIEMDSSEVDGLAVSVAGRTIIILDASDQIEKPLASMMSVIDAQQLG